jgi:hypothetical protein
MVYEPGGYNFMDYIKFGVPLQLVCAVFTVAIVFTLDEWWAYAVVFAILSPAIIVANLFLGGGSVKASDRGAIEDKASESALEEGHLPPSHGSESAKPVAAPSPETTPNKAALPIAGGTGSEPSHAQGPPDQASTSSALIFTGCA